MYNKKTCVFTLLDVKLFGVGKIMPLFIQKLIENAMKLIPWNSYF